MLLPQSRSEQGQMVVVIPILCAMSVSGFLLWGYMHTLMNRTTASANGSVAVEMIARNAAQRLGKMLNTPGTALSSVTGSCGNTTDVADTSINGFMEVLRDFAQTTQNTFQLVYTADTSSTATAGEIITEQTLIRETDTGGVVKTNVTLNWLQCLFTDAELAPLDQTTPGALALGNPLASMTIEVARLGPPDLATLSNDIAITATAISRQTSAIGQPRQFNGRTVYRLRVASLGAFPLVLWDGDFAGGPATPQISVGSGVGLDILGPVYRASNSNTATLSNITSFNSGSGSGVLFHRTLHIQAQNLVADTVSADTIINTFNEGIETNAYSAASYANLPIMDWGVNGDPPQNPNTWQQILDYTYASAGSILPLTTDSGGFGELPAGCYACENSSLGTCFGPGQLDGIASAYYNVITPPTAPFTKPASAAQVVTNTIPEIAPSIKGIPTLNGTCGAGGALPSPFVFQRKWENLVIDFTKNAPTDTLFCGLVAANKVTVILPADTKTRAIVGLIITPQLVIQGSAGNKLILESPGDNIPLTGYGITGVDQANIFAQFQQLASITGHNFFVPIFLNLALVNGNANFNVYRPHGVVVDNLASGGAGICNASVGGCPNPGTGFIGYCLTSGGSQFCSVSSSPVTAVTNRAALFPGVGSPIHDNLLYMADPIQ